MSGQPRILSLRDHRNERWRRLFEQVVIVGLAAWRFASLFVDEDGPWNVLERIRRIAGVPEEGDVTGLLPGILTCMWCATIWAAVIMWLIWEYVTPWPVGLMAAAGVAIAVERWNHGLR